MIKSARTAYLKVDSAAKSFGNGGPGLFDFKSFIFLCGNAEQAGFTGKKLCHLRVFIQEGEYPVVSKEFLDGALGEAINEIGYLTYLKEPIDINQELIEVSLYLGEKEYAKLESYIDGFIGTEKLFLGVTLSVVGMELGYEIEMDKFPVDKQIPIIGYQVQLSSVNE